MWQSSGGRQGWRVSNLQVYHVRAGASWGHSGAHWGPVAGAHPVPISCTDCSGKTPAQPGAWSHPPPTLERSICALSHSIRKPSNRKLGKVDYEQEAGQRDLCPRGQGQAHPHPPPKAQRRRLGPGIRVPTSADILAWIAYSNAPTFPTLIINLKFLGK